MLVVGPDLPASLRTFALSLVDAIRALQAPGAPSPLFACVQADLPPAAQWRHCVLWISDLNILAVSDGAAWIRQDSGVAI